MTPEIFISIMAALASLLGAGFVSTEIVRKIIYQLIGKPEPKKPYGERLTELTRSLTKASSEVTSILAELSQVAKEKQTSVKKIEQSLSELEKREKEIKERITTLENVPIPVAEHFAKLMESGEVRSAKRDYVLFGSGVLVTTLITIIIQLIS